MRITVTSNYDKFFADLEANVLARIPIATAIALTATAKDAQAAVVDEMERVFDDPTPYTLGAVYVEPATRNKQEARVWLKDDFRGGGSHPATEYLIPEIEGGVRVEKRSEWKLREAGVLPAGMSAVPGERAQLDGYGNMIRGQVIQILSYLRANERGAGSTSNRTRVPRSQMTTRQLTRADKQRKYFVSSRGTPHGRHLHPGVYERVGLRIEPVLIFVRKPAYRGRLDFNGVVQGVIDANLGDHLREQIAITVKRVNG